jgi:hypothetical protein
LTHRPEDAIVPTGAQGINFGQKFSWFAPGIFLRRP